MRAPFRPLVRSLAVNSNDICRRVYRGLFLLIYFVYWIFGTWGFYVVRKRQIRYQRLARQLYNARIDKLRRSPSSALVKTMEQKEYARPDLL